MSSKRQRITDGVKCYQKVRKERAAKLQYISAVGVFWESSFREAVGTGTRGKECPVKNQYRWFSN